MRGPWYRMVGWVAMLEDWIWLEGSFEVFLSGSMAWVGTKRCKTRRVAEPLSCVEV